MSEACQVPSFALKKADMKIPFYLLCAAGALLFGNYVAAAEKDPRCFELRVYYAAPGKLDALNERFRDHTLKLFEKHGMTNIGYWMPLENPDQKLIYLLAFPNREAQAEAWKAFFADPDWKAVVKETEAQGRLVAKVESTLLTATDFSPSIRPTKEASSRCFQLRTYTASPGNLENLLKRFRDHTTALFSKHGMTQIGYWTPLDKKQGSDNTLIYVLAHPSREAADTAFDAFRADPEWVAAKKASEVNGSLTTKVEALFMAPTDYSPTR